MSSLVPSSLSTQSPPPKALADANQVQGHLFSNVFMAPFLDRLAKAISSTSIAKPPMPKVGDQHHTPDQEDPQITQSWIWKRLGRFFREGDVVLADTGTASMGLPDAKFPANVKSVLAPFREPRRLSTSPKPQRKKSHVQA